MPIELTCGGQTPAYPGMAPVHLWWEESRTGQRGSKGQTAVPGTTRLTRADTEVKTS